MPYLITILFSVKFGTVTSAQGLKNRTAFDKLFISVSKMMQHQANRPVFAKQGAILMMDSMVVAQRLQEMKQWG